VRAGAIKHAQKLSDPQLIEEQTAAGHAVHTVYECCGFGYTLHEELCAAGAQSLVTTPMRLNLERQRKNDRMDATELCVRLSRYLDGHRHELRPIRIPSRAEQQRRELGPLDASAWLGVPVWADHIFAATFRLPDLMCS
jgi:transposase